MEVTTKQQYLKYAAMSALLWVALLGFVKLDKAITKRDAAQLNALQTLRRSSFARSMFLDIGVLSMLASKWTKQQSSEKWSKGFSHAIMWTGSFALLPFLTILFLLKALRSNEASPRRLGF